jgi:hypothetical protein
MADGMMANPYAGLLNLGLSPEQAQAEVDKQRALQFANLNPQQRMAAGIYGGLTQVSRALGARDPMLEQASQMRAMAQQFDTTTAEGLMQYAKALQQAGNMQGAQAAAAQAQQVMLRQEQLGETKAKAQKARAEATQKELTIGQENRLREELAKLPDDSTDDDVAKIVRKYGDPDKILKSIEGRQEAARARQDRFDAREREIRLQTEGRLQVAQQMGANAAQIASIRADSAAQIAQLRRDMQEGKQAKPTAGDRKALSEAQGIIQQTEGTLERLDGFAKQIDEGKLKFGVIRNLRSQAALATGRASEEDVEKDKFNRFVLEAANNLLLLAKGTQTEGDAQRARDQVVGALAKNDTNAVKAALDDLRGVLRRTQGAANTVVKNYNEDFGTTKQGAKPTDNFTVGKIYQDSNGNKAKYLGNGKWENM